ncbi:MAG: VOC family protein, partial [Hoeflea sp.]
NDACSIAFVQSPQIANIAHEIGVTHSGNAGGPVASGALQHLALRVPGRAALLALQDRIRSHGVPVVGPIDHGFCTSIYFAGPEHLSLEASFSTAPIDPRAWIDPDVVARAGISADELARFKAPAPHVAAPQRPPQPPADGPGPHLVYPAAAYARMLARSDAETEAKLSERTPPVAVG